MTGYSVGATTMTNAALGYWWRDGVKIRRWIFGAAVVWCLLHLSGIIGGMLFANDYQRDAVRYWSDLVTYLDAADALISQQPLYDLVAWDDVMTYHYHPTYAASMTVVAWLPFRMVSVLWVLLQTAAYFAGLWVWYRILQQLDLKAMQQAFVAWLPLALIFTEFFANIGYGNVGSLLFFLSAVMILGIVQGQVSVAAVAGVGIALMKPQWLFPLVVLIVLREWRFLWRLLLAMAGLYVAATALFVALWGVDYGVATVVDYVMFLLRGAQDYPWRELTYNFEDYNHSWNQIFLSYFGTQWWTPLANIGVRLLMIGSFLWLMVSSWRVRVSMSQHPAMLIWFAGLSFLLLIAMLPQLWELLGSIIFFVLLQAIPDRTLKRVSWLYLFYALYEFPALVSFGTGWDWLFLPQSLPLTMLALLVLYVILWVYVRQQLSRFGGDGL